jgi:tetratricopeptide (TPR) repeat protein
MSRDLPPPRPDTPSWEYARLARRLRADGRDEIGLAILDTARRLIIVDALVYYEVAQAHAAAGRIDRALAMHDEAIRVDPAFLESHWERGALLKRRGQVDEALEAWRRSDVTRNAFRHSLYLALALKSPRSTNESLLDDHREWARHHATPRD